MSNDKVAATFHGAEPTRERVEAYETVTFPEGSMGFTLGQQILALTAERDALRVTLDRVRAILDEWREEGEIRDALYDALLSEHDN